MVLKHELPSLRASENEVSVSPTDRMVLKRAFNGIGIAVLTVKFQYPLRIEWC